MVAIKDMEMPKSCYECIAKNHCGVGIADGWRTDRRADDCPLVEIEERKEGKWKSDGHGHIFCTACNEVNVSLWKSKYCPCCSAEMRGAENE